jgi:hypothetical protein
MARKLLYDNSSVFTIKKAEKEGVGPLFLLYLFHWFNIDIVHPAAHAPLGVEVYVQLVVEVDGF